MELLAPAGGFDQLRAAVAFGADAVYLAANKFGMRAKAANFSMEELPRAVSLAHDAGVKVYVTCNVMIAEDDLTDLPEYLESIEASGADALIIGDLGALELAKRYAKECRIHVSTQASVANSAAAKVWQELGASRIVLAREMTLGQIAEMRKSIPPSLELECFVHGAQCMAVSGRCLISSYLTGRSGNRGECTQPCRWNYTLEEEKRPGEHFPIEQDEATFIMNAKDLCMIGHLEELQRAGVSSIKIEGRNKKAFYVATVVGAYRRALDALKEFGEIPKDLLNELQRELTSVSHRPYGEGFYFAKPEQAWDFDGYEQDCIHVADVVHCTPSEDDGVCGSSFDRVDCEPSVGSMDRPTSADGAYLLHVRCRNRFKVGDTLEALTPGSPTREIEVRGISRICEDGRKVGCDVANRAMETYIIPSNIEVHPGSFLRIREKRRSARYA